MFQSKNAIELCALLVDEIYGELTSRLYSVLLRRGRLSIPLLYKHSHLSPRQLRHGLVVLIQQNLAYHDLDEDTGITYYEANYFAAYSLIRSGKILEAVESRYGAVAKDIVQNLLLLGHTRISHLESAYETKNKQKVSKNLDETNSTMKKESNGSIDSEPGRISTTGQLHAVLLRLLQAGVIEEVFLHMFRSPSDTYNRVEKETLMLYFDGSTKGNKQKEELKLKVKTRLQALRSDMQKWQIKGQKRSFNGDILNNITRMNKRRKISGNDSTDNTYTYEDKGPQLDSSMIIRVNYEKCLVFLRSQRLIHTVNDRIGKTTSLIYGEALRIIEEKLHRCQLNPLIDFAGEEAPCPAFTTSELTAAIGDHINPALGIANLNGGKINVSEYGLGSRPPAQAVEANDDEGSDSNEEKIKSESVDEYNTILNNLCDGHEIKRHPQMVNQDIHMNNSSGQRENKIQLVKNHLLLLAADEYKFLRNCGSAGLGEWTIDFKDVVNHLQEEELDSMLLENFGSNGHRLVRILRRLGKLDEKQLPNLALMKQKDVRTKLVELQMAGIVDIQEVPKDASRSVYRTIFLWFFDRERVFEMFVDNVFKIMSRALQRLDVERKKEKEILRLTQRSDVRDQDPSEYLDKDQLSRLAGYFTKEDLILTQITRLDELIGVFRDY